MVALKKFLEEMAENEMPSIGALVPIQMRKYAVLPTHHRTRPLSEYHHISRHFLSLAHLHGSLIFRIAFRAQFTVY